MGPGLRKSYVTTLSNTRIFYAMAVLQVLIICFILLCSDCWFARMTANQQSACIFRLELACWYEGCE